MAKKIFNFSPRFFTTAAVSLSILACLTYIGWQLTLTYRAPKLAIAYPANNLITPVNQLTINGQTEPESLLQINHERILVAPDGSFTQTINLREGLNQITIEAKKKHSQIKTISLSVYRQTEAISTEQASPHS